MGSRKIHVEAAKAPVQAQDPESPTKEVSTNGRRAAVLALAFASGAALMTLEIVGGRIVAAHLGSHVFMWGAVIGVFMGSLSLGYYAGGRLADRFPAIWLAGTVTAVSGAAVLLVPLIGNPVCRSVSSSLFTGNIDMAARWNPLVAVVIVFFAPATILGAITPIAIRLLALDMSSIGKLSARIYALNALGSILGTIITAFFLMSVLGNTWILAIDGIALILMGIGIVLVFRIGGDAGGAKTEFSGNNMVPEGTK